MDDARIELAQLFADMAQELAVQGTLGDTLDETVKLAVGSIPGCELASVSWLEAGREIETQAATDEVVAACDAAQYTFGEGPCVQAVWEGDTYRIDDMTSETRWPRFVARAAELGMRSMLACRLSSPKRTIGALNLYARVPDAFGDQSAELALIFAAHASIALANRRLENDLRSAVDTRGTIGQAMGIIVERHKITPQQAFELLVSASQKQHIKLRELAAYIVETGVDPDEANESKAKVPSR